jgi:hypothetical protein
MKQIPIAKRKVPKAASSVVRPSEIRGTTQLMLVSAGDTILSFGIQISSSFTK